MGINMRRTLRLFLLFVVLFCCAGNKAEAQFFKKLFGKDEPKRKTTQPRKVPVREREKPRAEKKVAKPVFQYPETEMKSRYRIDVLIPLYLDELVKDGKSVYKGKIPEKAQAGMDFYEGVKLATDTLNKQGYNIDVYVHDITSIGETPDALIRKKQLDSTNLIIAATPSQNLPALADFAQKNQVNIVSALSPSDADVKNNPYFILMQPSLQSHCEWIMEHVRKKHGFTNTTVLYRTVPSVDKAAYEYLLPDTTINLRRIQVNNKPTKESLAPHFSSKTNNIIVMGIMETSYAEELLQQLYSWFPDYRFEVYGMPSWKGMNTLKKADAYPNVVVNITAPFYFDPSTGAGNALASSYKKQYGSSKPNEVVFRGYETMYWYAYLLKKYGTVFNDKMGDNSHAPFTRYEVKRKLDKEENIQYLENQHISLYKYQSSSYIVEQ
jgi:ABC-type branched-subunit amino acid transport system substrate-binding protein